MRGGEVIACGIHNGPLGLGHGSTVLWVARGLADGLRMALTHGNTVQASQVRQLFDVPVAALQLAGVDTAAGCSWPGWRDE